MAIKWAQKPMTSAKVKGENARLDRWHKSFESLWVTRLRELMGPDWDAFELDDKDDPDGFHWGAYRPDLEPLVRRASNGCREGIRPSDAAEWLAQSLASVLKGGKPLVWPEPKVKRKGY